MKLAAVLYIIDVYHQCDYLPLGHTYHTIYPGWLIIKILYSCEFPLIHFVKALGWRGQQTFEWCLATVAQNHILFKMHCAGMVGTLAWST